MDRLLKLGQPPYLQVALDIISLEDVRRVVSALPSSDRLIIEAGTPLIKKEGLGVVGELRKLKEDALIVADLKTMDVGRLEAKMAHESGADAATVAGAAPRETIENFVDEARKWGMYSFMDTISVHDPLVVLRQLKELPDVVILHRAIDVELKARIGFDSAKKVKELGPLVAVAGGIKPRMVGDALKNGADVIIVGRYITRAKDVRRAVGEFLELLG